MRRGQYHSVLARGVDIVNDVSDELLAVPDRVRVGDDFVTRCPRAEPLVSGLDRRTVGRRHSVAAKVPIADVTA